MIEQEAADARQHRLQLLAAVLQGVEVDAHDLEALGTVGLRHPQEPIDLDGARQAPGRPEVDQDDLTLGIGEVERLAVDVRPLDGRRGLAHQFKPLQPAGNEVRDGRIADLIAQELERLAGDFQLVRVDEPLIVGVEETDLLMGQDPDFAAPPSAALPASATACRRLSSDCS